MKKPTGKRTRIDDAASIRKAINYYDHQSDENGAREIETAPRAAENLTWLEVPTELVPEVKKLINRHRRTA